MVTIGAKASPSDLDPNIKLGTKDDAQAINRLIGLAGRQSLKYRGTDTLFELALPKEQLFCESVIVWADTCNLLISGGGTKAATLGPGDDGSTDPADLGASRDMTFRNFCHWEIARGERNKLKPGFRISGPHTDGQRDRSLNSVLEAQHGIWFKSAGKDIDRDNNPAAWGFDLCGTYIDHVWGDGVYFGSESPYGPNSKEIRAVGVTIDRTGRMALCVNGVEGLHWQHGRCTGKIPSSIVHSETGQGKVVWQRDIWVTEMHVDSRGGGQETGAYALHWTGGGAVDGLHLTNWLREDEPVSCQVGHAGDRNAADGYSHLRNIEVSHHAWSGQEAGGYIYNFSGVDHLRYQYNEGPIRGAGMRATDCRDAVLTPNKLT